MKKVLGTDEAGRGAVVGPLCIAAVVLDEDKIKNLEKLGVKDSKKLTKKRREELEGKIKETVDDFAVVQIPAEKIDELMETKNLNRIEAETMSDMIDALKPDVAIIDATEANTEKVGREISATLDGGLKEAVQIVAENRADENHPPVSAASILAKTARDRAVERLERELNEEIGIGYPSDGRTIRFLKDCLERDGKFLECVRESWVTAERILEEKEQDGLSKFCEGEDRD